MPDTKITLSIIWIAVMLTYLWGDVLRILAGHATPGKFGEMKFSQGLGLGIAALMLIPILMVVLSLVLPHDINRWANIIIAAFWILFNLAGFSGYEGRYDQFLLIVSMIFNGVTIWVAWNWI